MGDEKVKLVTMKATVIPEAQEIWSRFCTEHGVTLGAYLQAVALRYEAGDERLGIAGQDVLELAREITSSRRRR